MTDQNSKISKLPMILAALALFVSGLAFYNAGKAPDGGGGAIGAGTTTENATVAYTPKTHASTHLSNGTDAINAATGSIDGLLSAARETVLAQIIDDGPISWNDWNEEFESMNTTATPASAAVVSFDRAWRTFFTGTGALITLTATGTDATHPGIVDLYAGTATNSVASLTQQLTGGVSQFKLGSGVVLRFEGVFQEQQVSNGTDTFVSRIGMSDNVGQATPANGVFFEYSSASPSSGNIICRACAASICTDGSGGSNVALSAATFYHVKAVCTGTTSCACTVNGTNVGSVASNIPTAAISYGIQNLNTAGTGAGRHLILDQASRRVVWSSKKAQ